MFVCTRIIVDLRRMLTRDLFGLLPVVADAMRGSCN